MRMFLGKLAMLRRIGQALGPYLILEIVMPGGTLMALLLYVYRRRPVAPALAFAGVMMWSSGCRKRAIPIDCKVKGCQ
ncbi:MAG: hypothetical protein ABI624_02575 [Casimicrobiaceae bacterium]